MEPLNSSNSVIAGTLVSLGCYLTIIHFLHLRQRKVVDKMVDEVLQLYKKASDLSETEFNKIDEQNRSYQLWHVYRMLTSGELIFESQLSMQSRGLLATYAIPSISSVLYQTGGFTHNVQRRYADMEILIREIDENPVYEIKTKDHDIQANSTSVYNKTITIAKNNDSSNDIDDIENNVKNPYLTRADTAFQRINAIHAKYGKMILHSDMLYTISVFMCSRVIWFDSRWSWRHLSNNEKEIVYLLWIERAKRMNIQVDEMNWKGYQDVLQFKKEYENKYMKFKESNQIVTFGTIDYFVGAAPSQLLQSFFRPFFRHILACLQESDRQVAALGLPTPPWGMKCIIDSLLTVRAFIRRRFLPPFPLSWVYRLTNPMVITQHNENNDTTTATRNHMIDNDISSDLSMGCPVPLFRRYQLKKKLNFGNPTFAPPTTYAIEELGPTSVDVGVLVKEPVYTGTFGK